ncbi:hypothetical protein B0H14DRAFT_3893655 [Mycena olivaceomarginata]|nr:hypothetical protein B0H14DRAFT_3893655 [Mycena olivaceomarginata]
MYSNSVMHQRSAPTATLPDLLVSHISLILAHRQVEHGSALLEQQPPRNLGHCVPCLTCGAPRSNTTASDSDDEYTNTNGMRGVRRARADELEGLLEGHDLLEFR